MTFVGRILVVIHLVLSVFFMAFAGAVYTTHANWQAKLKTTADTLKKAQADLAAARSEAESQKKSDTEKLAEMENEKRTFEGLYVDEKTKTASLEVEVKQTKQLLDSEKVVAELNSTEARDRASESMEQRGKNSQLYNSRNDVFAQLKDSEDKRFAMELMQQQFEQKYAQLLQENATYRKFLASKGLTTDPKQMTATVTPPTDVDGVVLEYKKGERGANDLVTISLGSDDDLQKGHELTVYGKDGYLARIKLLTVTPDRSIGLVLPSTKMKNTTIKVGDNVSTKL